MTHGRFFVCHLSEISHCSSMKLHRKSQLRNQTSIFRVVWDDAAGLLARLLPLYRAGTTFGVGFHSARLHALVILKPECSLHICPCTPKIFFKDKQRRRCTQSDGGQPCPGRCFSSCGLAPHMFDNTNLQTSSSSSRLLCSLPWSHLQPNCCLSLDALFWSSRASLALGPLPIYLFVSLTFTCDR